MSTDDWDETEQKERIKTRYREQTGEELPDHVAENIDVLVPNTADRMQRYIHASAMDTADADYGVHPAKLFLFLGTLAGSGIIGIVSTRFFEHLAAQLLGGLFVAVFVFCVPFAALWSLSAD